jgi:limonene-1,2-epoxide hydrolase
MPEENAVRTEVERENIELTREFNAAWSARDTDRLLKCVDENVVWMVYDGGPMHEGHAEVEAATRPFMGKFERIEFEILDLQIMGPVVIHERTENYYAPGGKLDTHFHVCGLLVIKDGKIVIWRDYGIPGVEQLVGPLVTQPQT